MEFYTYILPNGIKCIHKRVKSAVVHCAITINTGSRDELPSEFGMAHIVEHNLFKGTKRRRAYHINNRLENLGGELNAFTTKEETVIHATTLKSDYAKAVDIITDVVFHSIFPDKEIEKEKQVIFDEINLYKDMPSDRIYDDFEDMIFAGSSLGHNILGSKQSIKKFDSQSIKAFIARTYNTDQMVFSMIGDISEKSFMAVVDRYLKDIPANIRDFKRDSAILQPSFSKSVGRGTHQIHCLMGAKAYGLNSAKRLPLSLLVNMLGGPSANSILNMSLREKNALSYGVDSSYTSFSETGIASIYFTCEKDKADKCIELINKELDILRNGLISSRRLSIAKKQFLGQFSINMENNEGYMLGAAKSYLVFNCIDSIATVKEKIYSVTSEDIKDVANEVFGDYSSLIYR